jgi:mRNA interferase MazF
MVMQNDAFNESRMNTVVVCALTSNLRRARIPGNVLLDEEEADLTERSVINVSQLFTVDKEALLDKIGTLSNERVQQVFEGIYQLLKPEGYPLS